MSYSILTRLGSATAFVVALSCFWATSSSGAELLVSPTGEQMCLLYYRELHAPPPLDDFAKQAASVRRANEFDKTAQEAAERTRLAASLDTLADVKFLRINIAMSFSEYDTSLGEYTLSGFGANDYVSFNCFGNHQVNLRIDNSPYAQSWTLSPAAAAQVLKRNHGMRNIIAVSKIEVTGAEAADDGGHILVGKVREVQIIGQYTNAPLGSFAVPEK